MGGERLIKLRNRWKVGDHSQNILYTCINYQKINFLKLNNNKSNWDNNSLSNYQALRPNNPVGHTAYHFLVDKTKE